MPIERLLTIDQFMERTSFARATVYKWIQEKRLVEGVHYVRRGRCLRFPFPQCLEEPLADDAVPEVKENSPPVTSPRRGTVVNLGYGA